MISAVRGEWNLAHIDWDNSRSGSSLLTLASESTCCTDRLIPARPPSNENLTMASVCIGDYRAEKENR